MKTQAFGLTYLSVTVLALALLAVGLPAITHAVSNQEEADIQWILDQQVPNSVVPDPHTGRSGLVISYRIPSDDPDYPDLFSRSWIYDDAVAALALTVEGEYAAAGAILTALAGLVDTDGKLGFSYNTHDAWFHAYYRSGAIAWVGYAMAFYQLETGDTQYQGTAESIAGYLLTFQDPVCGSIRGGPDVTWYSTEHNVAAYFFFKTLGYVTGDSTFTDAGQQIGECLLSEHWNEAEGRFNQGRGDASDTFDVNTLGALFLTHIGRRTQARAVLERVEATFPITITRADTGQVVNSYKPYTGTETLWTEGGLPLAMAYDHLGDVAARDNIITETEKMRGPEGGIIYASPQVPDFADWEGVAPTGWMALARSANNHRFLGTLALQQVPISTDPAEEYRPQIARHGDRVYVAWYSGNDVLLATSPDGGWTWGPPVVIATGKNPAIVVDAKGNLHVSYWNSYIVYYVQSMDGGRTFTPSLSLGAGDSPDVAVDASGNPYVVWQGQWSGPDEFADIILARFTVQGYSSIGLTTTITTTIVTTTTAGYSEPPKVAVSPSGQNVYVFWNCPPHYPAYVRTYFARSIDGGDTFEPRCNPTGFTHHGESSPNVAAFGEDTVYITWVLDQYGYRRTNFARSENGGECKSFSPRLVLAEYEDNYGSTVAADALGQVCVAWRQVITEEIDLHFRCSLDGSQSFPPEHLLVSGPPGTPQYKPALALWNDTCTTYLDAVWEDARNGNRDILFSSIPVLGPMVGFNSPTHTVGEGDGSATITVSLCAVSALTVTVNFATSDGTALAGSDYMTASGTLTYTPGITSHTFLVPIYDDTLDETDETILLTLSDPINAVITSTNPVTLTILDDEWRLYVPIILRNYPANLLTDARERTRAWLIE
jgi:hypothetical protein